ncbi:MAG: DNA alkylation repair protein [Candidatus Thioglobus sp.]|nr:MAG: DNA alkylation repair protein [Candidatus Thioglobus sp.]KAA0454977.1 MAG: DNA alkylation repair protein [Candidatus Thioglobus sp.]
MEKFYLKDTLFNRQKVEYLGALIKGAYPPFDAEKFVFQSLRRFPHLELKQRIYCLRKQLEKQLPEDFSSATDILLKALPEELDANKKDNDFGDFIFAPLSDFVAKNGLQKQHLNLAFEALAAMTKRFSCEDSVRFFINKYPQQSLRFMRKMSLSDNYHQRRLASEGLRPKLPWCIGISLDYQKALPILNNLYSDKTRFVVRSVANHLNDIAKFDADLVVNTLKKWQVENRQKDKKQLDFLLKHSLRTLLKQGNIDALELLGFKPNPRIDISNFKLKNKRICLGEWLDFSFDINSANRQKLMIDYKIIYPSKNARKSTKVFKLKTLDLPAKTPTLLQKKHLFKLMSTKKLHSGTHQIQLQINGKCYAKSDFILQI